MENFDENYWKINHLINDTAPKLFRLQFKRLWSLCGQSEWKNGVATGKKFTEGLGLQLFTRLYKSKGHDKKSLLSGNIDTWDLPLLCDGIVCLQKELQRQRTPGKTATKKLILAQEIDLLKRIRNQLAHLGTTELDLETFSSWWKKSIKIFQRFGLPQQQKVGKERLQISCSQPPRRRKKKIVSTLDKCLIFKHRNLLLENRRFVAGKGGAVISEDPAQLNHPAVVNILGLLAISLSDMDRCKTDHIYSGYAIELRVVEDAIICGQSIVLLVQDKNGDMERVHIFNYSRYQAQIHQEFGYGCVFAIIDPYLQLMSDGFHALRVADPNLIVKNAGLKDTTLCRYCKRSGAGFGCKKCRRVFYCSKNCLEKDCQLNHSDVCYDLDTVNT